ncbi:substrate-binding domain-containing protein [Xanthomonas translucens pv. undulosa]|uniref:substrate-binding domain-containing protein n=1 Tax=Xanthomonas campestris pv. translucens TaxID=343 RepID=UPI003CF69E5D
MLNLHISRISAIAIAIAALSNGSAMAAENLYGGGATFPAEPYVGHDYASVTPNARLSTNAGNTAGAGYTTAPLGTNLIGFAFPVTVNSVFLAYSNASTNKVSYCQTGSAFGKNVLAGNPAANQPCRDFSVPPLGLSAAAAAPDFIATDAPYSTADYNAFLSGGNAASRVGIVQVPTLAGAIALPHSTPTTNFNLTAAQICQIYSGLVSDWASVSGSGTFGPIKIVYRADGSGTTLAFTSYLARTCNGTPNVPSGFVFTPHHSFNLALPGSISSVYGDVPPS